MGRVRLAYAIAPGVLFTWGGIFLYLYLSGRVRALLNPLFWPVELAGGMLLVAGALGYLLLFQPTRFDLSRKAGRAGIAQALVLIVPLAWAVALAPNSLSAQALERRAGLSGARMAAQAGAPAPAGAALTLVDFAAAAYYPQQIPATTGRTVHFLGQYFPGHAEGEFRFCRVLISCCAADATPIYLHIVGPAPKVEELQWIDVEGETFFRRNADDEWEPCLKLKSVVPAQPPPDPYLYAVRMKTS
jgi:uncharacterized repeat protein (TIGR03943 family)